jgi:hypothetical protein
MDVELLRDSLVSIRDTMSDGLDPYSNVSDEYRSGYLAACFRAECMLSELMAQFFPEDLK